VPFDGRSRQRRMKIILFVLFILIVGGAIGWLVYSYSHPHVSS
jgi:predicted nucleic acid-binding Zn ribbon protein